jgi:hypothetical protein
LIAISLGDAADRKNAADQVAKTSHGQRARVAYARALNTVRRQALSPDGSSRAAYARAQRTDERLRWALEAIEESEVASPRCPGEELHIGLTYALIDSLWVGETQWSWQHLRWEFSQQTHGGGIAIVRGTTITVPVVRLVPCPLAKKLLTDYSARDFGYDQAAWKSWARQESRCSQ